jgi:hypothetical protein
VVAFLFEGVGLIPRSSAPAQTMQLNWSAIDKWVLNQHPINILYNKSKNILVPILIHNSIDTLYYGVSMLLQIFVFDLGGGGV